MTNTDNVPQRGPTYGVMTLDDKTVTSVRFTRAETDGEKAFDVSFHMGNQTVGRLKGIDADTLVGAVGEKNAQAITNHADPKGSLKGEDLINEYGLTPDELKRRNEEVELASKQPEPDAVLTTDKAVDTKEEQLEPGTEMAADKAVDTKEEQLEPGAEIAADKVVDTKEEQLEPDAADEINIVEQVKEEEHEQFSQEEIEAGLARAALLRQRDREKLEREELSEEAERKRIKVENLSEKAHEQDTDNDIAERTGGMTDRDSQLDTEREKNRQVQLMEQVHGQFRVTGSKFYFKDQPGQVALKDKGERMVSASNDERVAKAMATMADAKGWKTIKVSGHPEFKREVWLEASMRGIQTKGYKPTEQDLKLLETKRERTMQNTVEHDTGRTISAKERKTVSAREPVQQDRSQPAAAPAAATKPALRAYEGTVLEHGAANYNHDPKEKQNYFVRLATEEGEKTVWGVDLKRAMTDGKVKPGDDVKLEYKGRTQVTVDAIKRDHTGKVIGKEEIETNRNQWDVKKSEKAQVAEAVASAFIDAKVKDPAQREALKAAVGVKMAEREKVNKVPAVAVYDKTAPSHSRQSERTGPVVERNSERVR